MPSLPQPCGKFFADRGTHLAAMIAYFALLSFVPLLFLTISLLSFAGRPDESSYLVTELKRAFPGSSISMILEGARLALVGVAADVLRLRRFLVDELPLHAGREIRRRRGRAVPTP